MRRFLFVWALTIVLAFPLLARAETYWGMGADIEYFLPRDSELYGSRMASNSWGKDIFGYSYSHGRARNHFFTANRYDQVISPGLRQIVGWDFGFSLELAERWMWLMWAPNTESDIIFNRTMIPITLTPKWSFNRSGNLRPSVGAGVGYYYVITTISGMDLYDQVRNPNYSQEGAPEPGDPSEENRPEPKENFRENRKFSRSGWSPGAHIQAGLELVLNDSLSLTLEAKWSVIPLESIDVEMVHDGSTEDWHWEERKISGDAGGFHGQFGVLYFF